MARTKGTKNSPTAKKTGPKGGGRGRVETVKELDRERIAYLLRMGYSQSQIAEDVKLSQPQVCIECKKIRERTLDSMIADRKHLIHQEYSVIMDVRRMAYIGFEAAKSGKKRKTREVKCGGEGVGYEKESTMEEGILPPSEYINVILKTNERICDLFGLDEAVKNIFNVTATSSTVVASPQDLVSLILGLRQQPYPVEAEVRALEDQVPTVVDGKERNDSTIGQYRLDPLDLPPSIRPRR